LQGYLYHYYCYYRLLLLFSHVRSVSSLAPNDTISMVTAAAATGVSLYVTAVLPPSQRATVATCHYLYV
jgi:hypothetical protein